MAIWIRDPSLLILLRTDTATIGFSTQADLPMGLYRRYSPRRYHFRIPFLPSARSCRFLWILSLVIISMSLLRIALRLHIIRCGIISRSLLSLDPSVALLVSVGILPSLSYPVRPFRLYFIEKIRFYFSYLHVKTFSKFQNRFLISAVI